MYIRILKMHQSLLLQTQAQSTKTQKPQRPPYDTPPYDYDQPDDTVLPFTDSEDETATSSSGVRAQTADADAPKTDYLTHLTRIAYVLLWITCWAIAIELQFGIVFLLVSAIAGIYYNTRTAPRRRGEVSAYSVFNRDCRAIDGTLKAEQFEQEIRYGSASVR